MPYWQLFYHLVWATKGRDPLLTPDVEPVIHNYLLTKGIGLGATIFALNGTLDHVHLVAAIPPRLAVATFVGQIKAVASTKYNKSRLSAAPFFWQEEYGAFSFDGKRLPNYIAYVERQKDHHRQNTIIPILERLDGEEVRMISEGNAPYLVETEEWRRELLGLG